MSEGIKTEDIIKSLLICTDFIKSCSECAFNNLMAPNCRYAMGNAAADRLERLSNQHIKIQYNNKELTISEMCSRMDELRKKANAARLENELLRGVLKSSGHLEETYEMKIDVKQLLKIASAVPIAEHNGRKLYAGTWHHFKGKDYFVCGTAVHTETSEILVLYKDSLASPKQYARPLAMFLSEVDREKYPDAPQKYRFERRNDT